MDVGEYIFTTFIILVVIIMVYASGSKKETKREKVGDAVGQFAESVASGISHVAHNLTESSKSKVLRESNEIVSYYYSVITSDSHVCTMDSKGIPHKTHEEKYESDKRLQKALDVLNISKEDFIKTAKEIESKAIIKYHAKYNSQSRANFFEKYVSLRNALNYFGISKEDWIKDSKLIMLLGDK